MMEKNIENKGSASSKVGKAKLYLLVTIVDRDKAKSVTNILSKNNMKVQFLWLAEGTAKSDVLDVLGLGTTDKAVVLCIVPDNAIPQLASILQEKLRLDKPGKGVVFSIPLSGAGVPVLNKLDNERWGKWQNEMEIEVDQMITSINHDLIIAVIDQGGSEELMAVARTAGATGGTMFHALRIGGEDAEKFFGISIQAKKDVVAILAKRENKQEIIKAISKFCNAETQSVAFSLPVENVLGLNQG